MSDIENEVQTPRLNFGAAPTEAPQQKTPVNLGGTYEEPLPDEAADYASPLPENATEDADWNNANPVVQPEVAGVNYTHAVVDELVPVSEPEAVEAAPVSEPASEPEEAVTETDEGEVVVAGSGDLNEDLALPPGTVESMIDVSSDPVEDPDQASLDELKREQERINKAIQEKEAAEKKAVIDQIVNVVKTYNVSTEELVEALGGLKIKRKGVPAKIKYVDPVSGSKWSGRGKEPVWIRESGKGRDAFRVAE